MEKHIKIHKALTCGKDEGVVAIADLLKKNKQRRVFVVDGDGKLMGVITTTDLVYKVLAGNKKDLKAKEIMTSSVEHVESSDALENALGVMNTTKSYVCPVTEKGKFIGVIDHHDIVRFLVSEGRK